MFQADHISNHNASESISCCSICSLLYSKCHNFFLEKYLILILFQEASPCVVYKDSSSYVAQPVACNPPTQTVVCKPSCFNAKQALYEKFPLLYKKYSNYCKLYCDKISGVNACPPAPTVVNVPCTTPTPTPVVYTPAPAPCPACADAANQQLPPEVLAYLGYSTPVSSCPYCSS